MAMYNFTVRSYDLILLANNGRFLSDSAKQYRLQNIKLREKYLMHIYGGGVPDLNKETTYLLTYLLTCIGNVVGRIKLLYVEPG